MPRDFPALPTTFVFAPALYPQSPLEGKPVFVHGIVRETKQRNGEWIARCADEKGEWETYLKFIPSASVEVGDQVRGFGFVERQPDGKTVLAARWVKKADDMEFSYCVTQTLKNWETILKSFPKMGELKPYVQPTSKGPLVSTLAMQEKAPAPDEFVSAHDLKIERDFV